MVQLDRKLLDLFQAAADSMSPWVGCYRLAIIFNCLHCVGWLVVPLAMHGGKIRILYFAVGLFICLLTYVTMDEIREMEGRFNIVPTTAVRDGLYRLSSIAMLIIFLFPNLTDLNAHGKCDFADVTYDGIWLMKFIALYFAACIQRHPPAKKNEKTSFSFV